MPGFVRHPVRNAWRIIGLALLALGLSGCSAIRLAYNGFDEVAYWWLDGYLDFSDAQSPRVREDLDRLHAWHRRTELPRWIELLQRLEQLAAGDISAQQACDAVAQLRERLPPLVEQAEPMATTLALGLSREQLVHLARRYQKNNAEFRKEWVRPAAAEMQDKRYKRVLERSEMIYGTLDAPQRAVLRAQIAQSAYDAQRDLAERERRQRDALDTLARIAGQPVPLAEARALLRGWFDRALVSPDAAYRAHQEQLVQESCRIFSTTHNATTPAQREMAVRRLRAYQRDLRELAAQP